MRKVWCALCLCSLALAGAPALLPGEEESLKSLIDRAIKAAGGAEKLAKYPAAELKASGTYHGLGKPLPFTGEYAIHAPNKMRFSIVSGSGDKAFKMTEAFTGDKGWVQLLNGPAQEMSKEQLAEARQNMYAGSLSHLLPLKEKAFKLAPLGKVKVGEHETVGVRVSHEGKQDVNLYFDNKSNLLVKSEYQIKDPQAGGKEQTQDVRFGDYKSFEGLMLPTKFTIYRDGKVYLEEDYTSVQPRESLPDGLFTKP